MGRPDNTDGQRKKSVKRRTVLGTTLRATGGLVAIAAVGGAARLWQTGAGGSLSAGPAFDPWRDWDTGNVEGLTGIVGAAILASSPHNSQPWIFTINDNIIDLHADADRSLGALDPFGREMMLGLGCAVENMVIGAEALGFTPILNLFPSGTASSHIARMTVFPGSPKERPEARFLTKRRTHRGPYLRSRRIPDNVLVAFSRRPINHGHGSHGSVRMVRLAKLSRKGHLKPPKRSSQMQSWSPRAKSGCVTIWRP